MTIRIGENIKRLRRAKNLTQEQIAELFDLSVTAVSKWERGETYPDITLLFPLARYFGVTLDELMGYDGEKAEAEIADLLECYGRLYRNPATQEEARALITKAYRAYPDDYRIMSCYMWNLGGDYADNDPAVLLAHREEFLAICGRIHTGCTDEHIRLDAWNMRAKLLHAEERTEEALAIYREKFPDWYQTCAQKSEQLFAKDTPEFRRQLRENLFELTDFAVNKKVKDIWFCDELSLTEKSAKALALADDMLCFAEKGSAPELCLAAYHALTYLGGLLRNFGCEDADRRLCEEKRHAAAALCSRLAEENEDVRAYLAKRYGMERL